MKQFALVLTLGLLAGAARAAPEPVFWLSEPYFPERRMLQRFSAAEHSAYEARNQVPLPETGELQKVWQDPQDSPWILMLDTVPGGEVIYQLRDERWQAYPAEPLNARMRALQRAFGITAAPLIGDLHFRQRSQGIEPIPIPESLTVLASPEGLWATVSKGSGPLLLLDDQDRVRRRISGSQGFVPALRQRKGTLWAWKAASRECLEIGPGSPRLHRGCGRPVFEDARGRPGFLQIGALAKDPNPIRISLYDRGRWIHRHIPGAHASDRGPDQPIASDDGQGRLWLVWDSRMQRIDPVKGQRFDVDLGYHNGPGGKHYHRNFLKSAGDRSYFFITGYDYGTCMCPETSWLEVSSEADFRRGLPNYDQNPSASFHALIF